MVDILITAEGCHWFRVGKAPVGVRMISVVLDRRHLDVCSLLGAELTRVEVS